MTTDPEEALEILRRIDVLGREIEHEMAIIARLYEEIRTRKAHLGSLRDEREGLFKPMPLFTPQATVPAHEVGPAPEPGRDARAAFTEGLPEALRRLMWDDTVGDDGVYLAPTRIEVPVPKSLRVSAAVLIAKGADGLWRGGFELNAHGWTPKTVAPTVTAPGYGDRDRAILGWSEQLRGLLVERQRPEAADAVCDWAEATLGAGRPKRRRKKARTSAEA